LGPTAPSSARRRIVYGAVWILLALPLPLTLWSGITGGMRGRDAMVLNLGLWAMRILLLGLALGPAARLLRQPVLNRYKRTFGLFGFTYAAVHGVYYAFYGRIWEFTPRIWERRLYIPIGIAALILLIPLAITSADGLRRRMGPSAWRRLHASLYPTLLLAGVHGLWQSNIDYAQPAIYLALTVLLLIVRLPWVMGALLRRTPSRRRVPAPAA
jgi:sulfoxide reductase heme-binding subunit YedZ